MDYSFQDHVHNYAVWTSARAVQRNFTTTAIIKQAIEDTTLRQFAENPHVTTADEFDEMHRTWAEHLINTFADLGVKCSYGRAAKVIAIYLKTAVVIPSKAASTASQVIHPPIDAILLRNISKSHKGLDLRNTRWTSLEEPEYWELIRRLRETFGEVNWAMEIFWTPEEKRRLTNKKLPTNQTQ